ncbi:S8 family serine peptidase [Asanoa sp. WMMD1127]|uniref:S8 family serine peptidase n=1 Tax=Asanoa sp. WMMD1127 TaxID=3016107 RepID=UPI002415FD40|nr:S8 family serine peptidase [Asanoa sp. WMMD1127]MDG4822523.1 S8 family serine peptidase [Asanoa sp. WMMD1127]
MAVLPVDRPAPPRWLGVVAALVAGFWIVLGTVVAQTLGYLVDQLGLLTSLSLPVWRWPLAGAVGFLLICVPVLLTAVLAVAPGLRAAGRAWFAAAAALAVLTAARAVPAAQHEVYLAVLALLALAGAAVIGPSLGRPPLVVVGGLLLLLPWLWLGALGGVLETALAVVAALAVGLLAAAVLGPAFWAPMAEWSRARRIWVGGPRAGVALALLGAGVGHSGPHLLVLLALPMVGFVLAALGPAEARGPAVAGLVALAVVGPLAFTDPEEVTLLLVGRDAPFFAAVAAASSFLAAAALALGIGLVRVRRGVALGLAGVLALGSAAVYAGPGQPGFAGDRLFVVLASQADLSGLPAGTGQAALTARTTEVYRRLVAHAEESQADLRRALDRWHLDYTPYYLVNGIEVDGGGPALRALLARRSDVDRVLLSQVLRPLPMTAVAARPAGVAAPAGPQWNLTQIGAPAAWATGATGRGIVVGASDSGVDGAHPALAPGFRGGDDSWYDPWRHTATPTDAGVHGTHTLGTAVGRGGIGVAPDAQWMGCVNLARNMGNPAHYLDCLQFMLAPFPPGGDPFTAGRPARAAQVLTNSWACPKVEGCDGRALEPAFDAFAAAGVFVVASAGNTGPACGSVDDPPAFYDDVLSVGSVDSAGALHETSSRGRDKPDVVAPGVQVVSALPGGEYGRLTGTSMAAPHVAGVVALLWSANPALVGDVARTRELLLSSAGPPVDACPPARLGGLVDAAAAVRSAG